MLEFSSLLIQPWVPGQALSPDVPRAVRTRTIFDASGSLYLGLARESAPTLRWLQWLTGPTLAVHEEPDESLLLVVERAWSLPPMWEVRDADGRPVGRFAGQRIDDVFSQPLAWIDVPFNRSPARFLAPGGRELGTVSFSSRGTLVSFAGGLEELPLVKMALLGALLRQEPGH